MLSVHTSAQTHEIYYAYIFNEKTTETLQPKNAKGAVVCANISYRRHHLRCFTNSINCNIPKHLGFQ